MRRSVGALTRENKFTIWNCQVEGLASYATAGSLVSRRSSPVFWASNVLSCFKLPCLLTTCCAQQRLTEEEQYAQLKKEADAAAAEEVGAIEQRMKEEQEKILKEMEAKRNAYDKMLDKLKHRKELEERREALRQDQQQRLKAEGKGGGLQSLMEQYEEHRKLLEEALAEEAERQHKKARERILLRQVERTERLHQKRAVEKQRFLLNQEEIKRQELALVRASMHLDCAQNLTSRTLGGRDRSNQLIICENSPMRRVAHSRSPEFAAKAISFCFSFAAAAILFLATLEQRTSRRAEQKELGGNFESTRAEEKVYLRFHDNKLVATLNAEY